AKTKPRRATINSGREEGPWSQGAHGRGPWMKSTLLDAIKAAARKPEIRTDGTTGHRSPQQRVIIVAQDERLRRSLREGLGALGFTTWGEASDALAAFTQIRRARPHLAVIALPLASLDGEQIAETLIRGGLAP